MIKKLINNKNLSTQMYTNVIMNYFLRGISITFGLFSTSLNLSYLGLSLYGQWATIASIASWINYGDLGIGNGFRNEFAKAVADNDKERQKKLIVSTSVMLGKVSISVLLLLFVLTEWLFMTQILDSSLRIPMYITNLFFGIDLFLGVGRSAAYGLQKSWLTSLAQSSTVILRIFGVLVLKVFPTNLVAFSIVNGIAGLIGNLILIIILYKRVALCFEKNIRCYVDRGLKKNIVGVGVQFFVLQITCLILYSSDNLIIYRIADSSAVTKYEMITKIFATGENLFSILLVSLWSAVTYAVTKGEIGWIIRELKRFLCIWGGFVVGVIGVSMSFNFIIKIWLGDNSLIYEPALIILFAVYTIWGTCGSIFVNISNGLGRLKVQLFFSSIEAIVNIPLSIYFASGLGMGIFGVKLATLLCCVGANIFVPIDIIRFLKKNKNSVGMN